MNGAHWNGLHKSQTIPIRWKKNLSERWVSKERMHDRLRLHTKFLTHQQISLSRLCEEETVHQGSGETSLPPSGQTLTSCRLLQPGHREIGNALHWCDSAQQWVHVDGPSPWWPGSPVVQLCQSWALSDMWQTKASAQSSFHYQNGVDGCPMLMQ